MPTPKASTKKYEERFVRDFHNELKRKNISLPVTVVLEDSLGHKQTIKNVSGMRVLRDRANAKSPTKVKIEDTGKLGTSKGDIALYSIANNGDKVDVAWISHKSNKDDNGKKILYAQYLDASADVNLRTRPSVTKEIRDFKNKMIELSVQKSSNIYCWPGYKDGKSLRIWDRVKSSMLMNMAIFGFEYGTGKGFSRQNANILMSGDPHIEIQDDNTIILTTKKENSANSFKGKSLMNGFAEYLSEDDQPIFFTKPTDGKKSTVNEKTIEGVSVWIIYRSYAGKNNKMIDDVIDNKNDLVSTTCYVTRPRTTEPKKPKGKSTGIKYNGYNVYFDDTKANPYAAFRYMNNTNTTKPVKYNVVRSDGAYVNFLKKNGKNKIPSGKVINPETGFFVQEKPTTKRLIRKNLVKSNPLSSYYKPQSPFKSSPSSYKSSPSPYKSSPSPYKSSPPFKLPLPKLLSPTLPMLPKSPSLRKSPSLKPSTSQLPRVQRSKLFDEAIPTGEYYETLKQRKEISYLPSKNMFVFEQNNGKPRPIASTEIHKYIKSDKINTIRKGKTRKE
jgi:hypothetical protein